MLLLGAVCFALHQSRVRLQPAGGTAHAVWQPDFLSVECPPPGSDMVLVHPRPRPLAFGLVALAFLIFAVVLWLTALGKL
jgi:hypothetical protein